MKRRRLVLPAPEGPTRKTNSPLAISRSTPSTATCGPGKTLVTARKLITLTPLPPGVVQPFDLRQVVSCRKGEERGGRVEPGRSGQRVAIGQEADFALERDGRRGQVPFPRE